MARKNVYKEKLEEAKKWLEAIRDYAPIVATKNERAYDSLLSAVRDAAKNGLAAVEVDNAQPQQQ
jgi:hypothetical protein